MKNKKLYVRICSLLFAFLIVTVFLPTKALAFTQPEPIKGTGAIVIEPDTGRILYEYNADSKLAPASTTKILTALLVFEAAERGEISLDDKVAATQTIIDGVKWDASRATPYITDGEILTVRDYLYCILLASDCLACDVVADHTAGSVEAFVERMNQRAAELSCTDFNFVNTHGYPDDKHYASARTLALITQEAIKHPEFCEIFGTIKITLEKTNLGRERKLYNTDWMLWDPEKITSSYTKYYYPYAKGGKTGSSNASGQCLASYAEKDDIQLICVLTGAKIVGNEKQSFTESEKLYRWAYDNWGMMTVLSSGDIMCEQTVVGGKQESVPVYLTENLTAFLPKEISRSDLTIDLKLDNETVEAPINAFAPLGTADIYFGEELLATIPLAAETGVEKKGLGALGIVAVAAGVMLVIVGASAFMRTQNKKKAVPAYSTKRNGAARAARYGTGGSHRERDNDDYVGYRDRIPEMRETNRVRAVRKGIRYDPYDDYNPFEDDDLD